MSSAAMAWITAGGIAFLPVRWFRFQAAKWRVSACVCGGHGACDPGAVGGRTRLGAPVSDDRSRESGGKGEKWRRRPAMLSGARYPCRWVARGRGLESRWTRGKNDPKRWFAGRCFTWECTVGIEAWKEALHDGNGSR